jgi:hypothetical protein
VPSKIPRPIPDVFMPTHGVSQPGSLARSLPDSWRQYRTLRGIDGPQFRPTNPGPTVPFILSSPSAVSNPLKSPKTRNLNRWSSSAVEAYRNSLKVRGKLSGDQSGLEFSRCLGRTEHAKQRVLALIDVCKHGKVESPVGFHSSVL